MRFKQNKGFIVAVGFLLTAGFTGCSHPVICEDSAAHIKEAMIWQTKHAGIKMGKFQLTCLEPLQQPPSNTRQILQDSLGGGFVRQFVCCYVTEEVDPHDYQQVIVYHCHLRDLKNFVSQTPGDTAYRAVKFVGKRIFVNGFLIEPKASQELMLR